MSEKRKRRGPTGSEPAAISFRRCRRLRWERSHRAVWRAERALRVSSRRSGFRPTTAAFHPMRRTNANVLPMSVSHFTPRGYDGGMALPVARIARASLHQRMAAQCAPSSLRLAHRSVFRRTGQRLRPNTAATTAECGVSVRVGIAIAAYLLVAILQNRLSLFACLRTLGEMFALTFFGKPPLARTVAQPQSQTRTPDLTICPDPRGA